jgi:ubiquinone/menaquinone biosynthesis C-methylase UbiE
MLHKFNPENVKHLDNPLRKILYPPKRMLTKIGLIAGDVLLDVGAGSGYYAFPASEIVGEKGRVIAIDSEPVMIRELTRKAKEFGKKNVQVVQSREDDLGVPPGAGSIALLSTVLHEVEDKKKILHLIKNALNERGRIAIVEFRKGALIFGPPNSVRIGKEEIERLLNDAGYRNIKITNVNLALYLTLAEK